MELLNILLKILLEPIPSEQGATGEIQGNGGVIYCMIYKYVSLRYPKCQLKS